MSWNDGHERKRFERKQRTQANEYHKYGMNEEQIHAMYLQDLQEYRNDRFTQFTFSPLRSLKATVRKAETHCTKSSCFR